MGFFDITGSVTLHHELGEEKMAAVHRAYFAQGRALTEEFGGCVVKTNGDDVVSVFHTAVRAFDCALKWRANTGHELVTMHIGIALGPGRITDEGNDIHGDVMNFASRLEGVARKGEIVVSGIVKDHIDDLRAERHAEWLEKWIDRFLPFKGFGKRRVWILPQ